MAKLARLLIVAGAFIATATIVTPAIAQPVRLGSPTFGYTYFNRPGADVERHDTDLRACVAEAALTESEDARAARNTNPGLVGGLLIAAMTRGTRPAALENCMVVRGWRVVRLPDEEGRALSSRTAQDIAEAIAPWIGAPQPNGDVVRVWNNDAMRASTDRYDLRPSATPRGSLSLLSIELTNIRSAQGSEPPMVSGRAINQRSLPTSVPSGQAMIVVHVRGISPRNGVGISFERLADGSVGVEGQRATNGTNAFLAWGHGLTTGSEGVWRAFVVPPGRWRILGLHALLLCLGAPALDARAGDVVYAGSFDLSSENLGPDLGLEAAQTWLADRTNLSAALRPASYTNGWRGQCGASAIYALEVAGAPFRDGYTWGSNAAQ